MGREVRRVPPDWEHPRDRSGNYHPMFEKEYTVAAQEWLERLLAWERGEDPSREDAEKDGYRYLWDWDDMPPDKAYYRERIWSPDEATAYQVYEDVTEGTPISPVFKTQEALIAWLVEQGYSEASARAFAESGWVPSIVLAGGKLYTDINSADVLKPK